MQLVRILSDLLSLYARQKSYTVIMQVHNPLNKQFSCPTCQQPYASNELFKDHYKSEFHRYNIKRKMVKLPPVTPLQFSTKQQQTKIEEINKFQCNQCNKKFASANTLKQHVDSKGHDPHAIVEAREKTVRNPAPFAKNAKRCLFCELVSRNVQESLSHMQTGHGFFISQLQFCKNKEGLLEYLQEKIEVGNLCITCENKKAKDFQTADAVRKHMIDKSHTFMKTEDGFEEYEKYYDFSRLFDEKLKEQAKIVPGIQFQKVRVIVEEKGEGENEGDWEDEEGEDQSDQEWEEDGEEEKQIAQVKKPKVKTYRIMRPTITANDELLLPNGKILGHRKYRYLYRQAVHAPHWFTTHLKQIAANSPATSNALIDRHALIEIIKKELMAKKELVRNKKYHLHLGLNNNDLQRHYRNSNPL